MVSEFIELMSNVNTDIVNAINKHSEPGKFDYYLLALTVVSILLSFVTYFQTRKVANRQINIMEQQKKISLHERCYRVYSTFLIIDNILKYVTDSNEIDSKSVHTYLVKIIKSDVFLLEDRIEEDRNKVEFYYDLKGKDLVVIDIVIASILDFMSILKDTHYNNIYCGLLKQNIEKELPILMENKEEYREIIETMKQQLKL